MTASSSPGMRDLVAMELYGLMAVAVWRAEELLWRRENDPEYSDAEVGDDLTDLVNDMRGQLAVWHEIHFVPAESAFVAPPDSGPEGAVH